MVRERVEDLGRVGREGQGRTEKLRVRGIMCLKAGARAQTCKITDVVFHFVLQKFA